MIPAVCCRPAPGAERILRIRIVINELREVCEKIEFQERLWWRPRNSFAILAEYRRRWRFSSEDKGVFPLLSQSFRIDVGIPNHARGDKRIRHSACSESEIWEPFVTAVGLADVDDVAALRKGTPAAGRAA